MVTLYKVNICEKNFRVFGVFLVYKVVSTVNKRIKNKPFAT